MKKTSKELIEEYLKNGGKITKCKNYKPASDQYQIKVKSYFNINTHKYIKRNEDDYKKNFSKEYDAKKSKNPKKEDIRIFGVNIKN